MPAKAPKKQKPQDMVLRLMRVAEILLQGQAELTEPAPHPAYKDDRLPQAQDDGQAVPKTQT